MIYSKQTRAIKTMKLKEVLAGNPFTLEVVSQWKQDLKDFNFGRKRLADLKFVLNGDLECLGRKAREKLHTELLPKPFMGNPNAPVWYLPLNPSYSEIDRYDDLGIKPGMIRSHDVSEWLDRDKDKIACRAKRQDILLSQLRLDGDCTFTFLEEAFNTLGDCPSCKDNGGYRWWRRRLFGAASSSADFLLRTAGVEMDAKSVGAKLFVLESFPYHSRNFNVEYYTSTDYFSFWKNLVEWGINNGKKFIIRARNRKFIELTSRAKLNFSGMNCVGLSGEGAFISRGNLTGEEDTIDAIRQLLSER